MIKRYTNISSDANDNAGSILVLTAGALWGTIGLFIKQMSMLGTSALLISFLRVSFSFVIMLIITIALRGIDALKFNKRQLFFSAMLGIICHGIYNIFYSYAVSLAGVTISAVLLNIAPALTMISSVILFSESATIQKVLAVIINICGCILTATGGDFRFETVSLIGVLCGIGAGASYAMTAIIGKFAMDKTDVYASSTYSYLFASLFLFIPANPASIMEINNLPQLILLASGLALIPTAIGYVVYYKGLQLIKETSKVPILATSETIVATILGISIYHEKLNIMCGFGIILVLFSILLMNKKKEGNKNA